MVNITMYLDGGHDEYRYRFVVKRDWYAHAAFRTVSGFRYFLEMHGLEIDASMTQLHDLRDIGRGRFITTACKPKKIDEFYFWKMEEIPEGARPFISICNGSYVNCYSLDTGDTVTIYKPNPNAKNVYIPYNDREMADKIG